MKRVYISEWRDKIIKLMSKHDLTYLANPGGGQFYNDHINIQIHDSDYSDEYSQLLKGLQNLGLEP